MSIAYRPQTVGDTMARIAAGVDPWIAYRDFLEDWTYLPEARVVMIVDPPPYEDAERHRWATLLAATVEALCARDGIAAPAWTKGGEYCLPEPWYLYLGTGRIREWLRESSPPPFASRNIWSGDRLLRRA